MVNLQKDPITGDILGTLDNISHLLPGDPRVVKVSDPDFAAMGAGFDARGLPRWRHVSGQINYVPPASRAADTKASYQAWVTWRSAKNILDLATGDGLNTTRPGLYQLIQLDVAAKLSALNDTLRAATASDDTAPSVTTITPL